MADILDLNEALLCVNKSNIFEPLELFFKIDECFGCPLEKLRTITEPIESFAISTKSNLQLEIRRSLGVSTATQTTSVAPVCHFEEVSLNSHGHYQIDVSLPKSPAGTYNCSMRMLDRGDCSICPFAVLICFLFLITAAEQLYSHLLLSAKRRRDVFKEDSREASRLASAEHQAAIETEAETEVPTETVDPPANQECTNNQTAPARQQPLEHQRRLDSLDAFRGLTIAAMIMVNYGGAGYSMLQHKAWDGLTIADLVFPFFIFSMGASIAISTRGMMKRSQGIGGMLLRVLKRSCVLMLLGLCLNSKWLADKNVSLKDLRLTGVLQRFSVSYLVVALIYTIELVVHRWIKSQSPTRIPLLACAFCTIFELMAALNQLALYIYVSFYLEYDSLCPPGYLGPGGQTDGGKYANCTGGAAAWLDRQVLGERHLYHDHEVMDTFKTKVSHDPEGILGYTTSILLTLIGLQCGKILLNQGGHRVRLLMMSQWMAMMACSTLAVVLIPINKRLWSLTFVSVTATLAFLVMMLLYLALDVFEGVKSCSLSKLLISAGRNSIVLYVGHSLLTGMLPWWFYVDNTSHIQLLCRLVWSTFVWLLIAQYLAHKKLFVRL